MPAAKPKRRPERRRGAPRQRRPRAAGGGGAAPPVRRCAVTRRLLDKSALIRFVRAPDGTVVPDVAQKLPGRGIWVGAEQALVSAAARRKGPLARAGRVPPDIAAVCERALTERAQGLLGLARGAGRLAIGARAARNALASGEAAVLVQARDAAADGRAKLERLRAAAAPACAAAEVLSRAEIAAALGRDAAHAVVLAGGLAERFKVEAGRLAGFGRGPAANAKDDAGQGRRQET